MNTTTAIIGAGWAGCAAAVAATDAGQRVTVFEAARTSGGRARHVRAGVHELDNGQHILIGAYTATLGLMLRVGIDLQTALLRLPLALKDPKGKGIELPGLSMRVPAQLAMAMGVAMASGLGWRDKIELLTTAKQWQLQGFTCSAHLCVADLCAHLPAQVRERLIDPLCVSALNTPPQRASAQMFLRVLHDSLLGPRGSSNLLLPLVDLSALLPEAALSWVLARQGHVRMGTRVEQLVPTTTGWLVDGQPFDKVVLACPPWEAARLVQSINPDWADQADALEFEAITTVYAQASGARLRKPMLLLPSSDSQPAQFVFDRGQLGDVPGMLAFVVSASLGGRDELETKVVAQGQRQLGLPELQAVQTITEKRATFSCTPGLKRPPAQVARALQACGDYIDGPYPATLEGAVRSGLTTAALRAL